MSDQHSEQPEQPTTYTKTVVFCQTYNDCSQTFKKKLGEQTLNHRTIQTSTNPDLLTSRLMFQLLL